MTATAPISRLMVWQTDSLVANRYEIRPLDDGGEVGELLAVAQQKVMALKKEVTFYADAARTVPIFSFKGRESLETFTVYDINDADGGELGWFKREFRRSITRSTWQLAVPDIGLEATGIERSHTIGVARRAWNLVLGEYLRAPLQFHFDFRTPDGLIVMICNRRRRLRDVYDVTLPTLADGTRLDWRIGAVLGVAMDTLEHR